MKKIISNKKAFHDYEIIKKFDTGIELEGWEVKSIKNGSVSLKESHVADEKGQMFIFNMHVAKWKFASNNEKYDEMRKKKLLLKKAEINYLAGKVKQKGLTIIPLEIYEDRGLIKMEIGLARGTKEYEKREKIKKKEQERSIQADLKSMRL